MFIIWLSFLTLCFSMTLSNKLTFLPYTETSFLIIEMVSTKTACSESMAAFSVRKGYSSSYSVIAAKVAISLNSSFFTCT